MMFHDEFDEPTLDTEKWSTELRWGRVNGTELQYYAPDAFEFGDGHIRIRAEKRQTGDRPYSSGVMATFRSFWFTYGYAEMRARVPAGKGLWPGFWLLAQDPQSGAEIDVMEFRGQEPQKLHMVVHSDVPDGGAGNLERNYSGPDFSRDFHTYGVRWDRSKVVWYVDGVERFRVTQNVPQKPMHLIVNLAIGGDWVGAPDSNTQFPAYLDVDYVRVYQQG